MTERRRDPLSGEWRTVTTHRQDRTFLPGEGACPLCPGGLEVPDADFDVFVFDNRFPSFSPAPPAPAVEGSPLYEVAPAAGAAEMVVYSPKHNVTMAELGVDHIARIVDVWAERVEQLGARDEVAHVFVFENRGEVVGATLRHPHGQIYGYPEIPPLVRRELELARREGSCRACAVVAEEADGPRLVTSNGSFVAHVPFAPRFPYEVHVVARRHLQTLGRLDAGERRDLAEVIEAVVGAYDRRFGFVLPYVMSVHQAPTDGGDWDDVAHLRVQFTPVHRSPERLKHLAGSELHAGAFLVDVAPEDAARELRG